MNTIETALLFLGIAAVLVVHHIYKHTELPFPQRAFEIKDISNHETWILVSLTVFIVLLLVYYGYFK